jgi:Fe-S-cluster containining protein
LSIARQSVRTTVAWFARSAFSFSDRRRCYDVDATLIQPEATVPPDRIPISLLALEHVFSRLDDEAERQLKEARAQEKPEDRPACRRGCAACCHQLVPLTTIEAQRIAEYVSHMPRAARRELAKSVDRQAQRFAAWAANRPPGGVQDRAVNVDYLKQRIPCPFLGSQNECRVYPVRPLICRGHHALGSNANCQTGTSSIRAIPALGRATEEAMATARGLTAQLGVATQGGFFSTFAPLFRAALSGKSG